MFRNILVAADGSDHAARALHVACDLAKAYDAGLHVVHVPELPVDAIAMGASAVVIPPRPEAVQEAGKPVIAKLEADAKAEGVTPASATVLEGDPAQAILDFATTRRVDLIVMGRRGLGTLTGLLLGSVSQKLASHAPCPVLTVK